MKFLNQWGMRAKLITMVSLFTMGFLAFVLISQQMLNRIKVTGPVYDDIVRNKDLVADILPPPEYIIEPYLTVLQMLDSTQTGELDAFAARMEGLQTVYKERHQYWQTELKDEEMRKTLLRGAHDPALSFFKVYSEKFLPAIKAHQYDIARTLAYGSLLTEYDLHRTSIDKLVGLARTETQLVEESAKSALDGQFRFNLIFSAAFVIFLYVVGDFLCRQLSQRIQSVLAAFRHVETENDLTYRLDESGKDEASLLSKSFNALVGNMQTIVGSLRMSAHTLSSAAEELTTSGKQMEELSGRLDQTSREASTHSKDISIRIQSVSDEAERISNDVRATAASVEEMSATINEVSHNCQNESRAMKEVEERAAETEVMIGRLQTTSQEVGKIVDLINAIASQTNLLALNAAIEAASAGDAGKGFSVVASEVKQLSQKTANATAEITSQIQGIQAQSQDAAERIKLIATAIRSTTETSQSIAAAIEEQSATVLELSRSVQSSSGSVTTIADSVRQGSHGIGLLNGNVDSVALASKESISGISQMRTSTQELAVLAADLNQRVAEFRV
jgi:methyl-accepting chemotaxis protein